MRKPVIMRSAMIERLRRSIKLLSGIAVIKRRICSNVGMGCLLAGTDARALNSREGEK